MKKELSESLIIIIIGLALIFFDAIVKILGLVIVVYGIIELFRERKEKKAGESAQPSMPKEVSSTEKPTQDSSSPEEKKGE